MAVTSANKVRVVETANSSTNQDSYDVLYKVIVDDKNTTLDEVINSPLIPALGAEFSEIPGNYCTDKKANLIGTSRLAWNVTVTFTNKPLTVYTWGTKTRREVLTATTDFKPIVNSAGDPFSPALTTDKHMLTLKVEREEPSGIISGKFSPTVIEGFVNTVNKYDLVVGNVGATYTIVSYTGLMEGIQAVYNPGKDVWKVTYNITIRQPDPSWEPIYPTPFPHNTSWVRRVLDAGLQEFETEGDDKKQVIFDKRSRTPVTKARPLDGKGKALADDATSGFVWLAFEEFEATSWAFLDL